MLLVPCLACGALLEQGALRCRFCNASGRTAAPRPPVKGATRRAPRPAPMPPRARAAGSWLEQLVAASRDLFGGP